MLIIGILIGFILGAIVNYIIWYSIVKSDKEQIEYFRQEYFKTHSESVKHFRNEMKLRALVREAFNLIDTEYTFRRHSDIWKQVNGLKTYYKLKQFIDSEYEKTKDK